MIMPRLLLVEDDPSIRHMFTLVIKTMGWEVEAVGSAETALEAHGAREFDVVFLDNKLPMKSGVEAAHEIRSADQQTPIVLSSAGDAGQYCKLLESLPKMYFLSKPLRPDDLRELLAEIVSTQ